MHFVKRQNQGAFYIYLWQAMIQLVLFMRNYVTFTINALFIMVAL